MQDIRWQFYPHLAAHESGRLWLELQARLGLAAKTIDAYGRALDDYLAFCERTRRPILAAMRGDIAAYADDMAHRPRPHGREMLQIGPGPGLSNATMRLRIAVVRLFYDYLHEMGLRADVPLTRRSFTPGNGFYGTRDRALVPYFERFPWIPGDDEWEAILGALAAEPVRNRLMLLLSYDGALRRGELLALSTPDIRAPLRQIMIRPEIAKNRSGRIVLYGAVTAELLRRYLDHRRTLGVRGGALFRSESPRNRGQPLSIHAWSKIVAGIAERAGTPQFTPHTLRHLRLTDLARCGIDLHAMALYAGHRSLDTTRLYVKLSGGEIAERVRASMERLDRRLERVLHEEAP